MRITGLVAENFKRLRVVEIHPRGRVINITGKNDQGKTSLIDSIWATLGGGKAVPERPVRKGEQTARTQVEMIDEETGEVEIKLIATRYYNAEGTTRLTLEAANGARLPRPQEALDRLIGAIAFDPAQFWRLSETADGRRRQLETLRSLVKIDVDIDALDGLNARDYEKRTDLNRDAARLRAQAQGIPVRAGLPESRVDIEALIERLRAAGEGNTALERRKSGRVRSETRIAEARRKADEAERQIVTEDERITQEGETAIAELQAEIDRLNQRILDRRHRIDLERAASASRLTMVVTEQRRQADQLAESLGPEVTEETVETTGLAEEIETGQRLNEAVAERDRARSLEREAEDMERQAQQLTIEMAARTELKRGAIARAKMPVEGLGFGEEQLLLNDLPMSQASSSQRLRVSVAIAMAMNPKLRVLLVRDAQVLDDEHLALLAEMAEEHDYQLWVEQIRSDDPGRVEMVDGEAHVEGRRATPKKAETPQLDV
jgi:hypothetical protein